MSFEFTPYMSPGELALLTEATSKRAKVLEFGCGGSTQFFFEQGVKHVISIDSDKSWLERLLTNPVVFTHYKYHRWLPVHADIGRLKIWGVPYAQEPRVCWLNYHQDCWNGFHERNFDLILIDGRFRVACVCQSLLRCDNSDVLFIIHDFWNRPHYHVVLDFLHEVQREDSLGIFKPKLNINWKLLSIVLQKYQFDYK